MKNSKLKMKRGVGLLILLSGWALSADARVKMVALPERAATDIRLDNPRATVIEEERVLTLQKGVNKVDFSWKGVEIDADSIRLTLLDDAGDVTLLNVSYPPNEQALVWEISSGEAKEQKVRITYLLSRIDRLVTYKLIANKDESKVDLKSFLVLRNFSGEDFENARVLLDYGEAFERGIQHGETKQLLFFKAADVLIEKIWTFDAAKLPWDPEKEQNNVGIPVTYRVANTKDAGLGEFALSNGKVRVFQEDGSKGSIMLGEDMVSRTPIGEAMDINIGDSRDISVTQKKMVDKQINTHRNKEGRLELYDTDEVITATLENFKDTPAKLTLIQHIKGEWEMLEQSHPFTKKSASVLVFEIELPANGKVDFKMHYSRRNCH